MTVVITTQNRMTIGIDLGDRSSQFCVLDGSGAALEEGRLTMGEAAFRQRFGSAPRARIEFEAGTHSPWVSALLAELDHGVVVANARKLRMISSTRSGVCFGIRPVWLADATVVDGDCRALTGIIGHSDRIHELQLFGDIDHERVAEAGVHADLDPGTVKAAA